ncbi:hypothetical protein R6Q59_013426 [Mikania micrantha]
MQMDQQKASSKSKNTILKFLPRATSSVSFQNPPIYSPAKEKRSSEKLHKSHLGIGFSGPMVSMINTDDTRRIIKTISDHTLVFEPTSPRVSCMGQIKCKHKRAGKPQLAGKKPPTGADKVLRITAPEEPSKTGSKSKKKLGFKKLFGGLTPGSGGRRKSNTGKKNTKVPLYLEKAPSLGTMKRFSSGRDKLSDFDWKKEGAAMDSGDRRYDSDEESDDERVIAPSSAPVMIRNPLGFDDKFVRVAGNTEPRKEINLWKRRTMPQPKPLRLNNI